jgi:hypothetical protein
MIRFTTVAVVIALGLLLVVSLPHEGLAQGPSNRGIGLAVTFPLPLLPPATETATVFLDLLAQAEISPNLVSRLEARFFIHFLTGFRTDLTSARASLLVLFTPSPAVFYIGGGAGVFPIQGVPAGNADGLMLSVFARTGIEVQVAPLGLFLDLSYEVMPQPFADIAAAGVLVASALQISVGTIVHF